MFYHTHNSTQDFESFEECVEDAMEFVRSKQSPCIVADSDTASVMLRVSLWGG